jgi:hydroxymethylpyrimidine/phosphomethylpyrimidine kinase
VTGRRVLLLGGIDPSGGAGLTLDACVVAELGAHPLPVPVVLTAQNRHGFRAAFPVPEPHWRAAFDAACADGALHAVKIGLLGNAATATAVAAALAPLASQVPIVVDPVLSATAGGFTAAADLAAAYREHLAPLAALLTPNLPELATLYAGDLAAALRRTPAVLVKGGHGGGGDATDLLVTREGEQRFSRPRLPIGPVRGTGCALAAALAARLAQGHALADACRAAGDWLHARLAALGPPPTEGLPRTLLSARTAS